MVEPPLRVLILFQGTWEDDCVEALRQGRQVTVRREGFDPLTFVGWWRSCTMNVARYVDRLCRRHRGRIDAVWSLDDMFGCLLAAVVARRLGLPGPDPAAIVRAQHKLLFRRTLAATMPQANVPAISLSPRDAMSPTRSAAAVASAGLGWPVFCKPVRAAFSVLARHVASATELAAHLRPRRRDLWVLRCGNRPFDRLMRLVGEPPCPAAHLQLEAPMRGAQVNVDGYVHGGTVHVLGVVDELMYPGRVGGAHHFAGFLLPSRQPAAVLQRVREVAAAAVRAVGYDLGLFNVELFVGDDGDVRVIEMNPRGAGQFATMYRAVHGFDLERLAIQLAAGRAPETAPRHAPYAAVAASLVFRRFDGQPGPRPSAAALAWLAQAHPRARLWCEPCGKRALRWEYRWLGSHRYAVLNLAAADLDTLRRDGDECARRLFGVPLPAGVEADAAPLPMTGCS